MLELAILGLLAEQQLHGYELKKRLRETLGPLWGISFGSLYPGAAPARAQSGAIEAVEDAADADPAPAIAVDRLARRRAGRGPRSGARPRPGRRTRKVYGITDRGPRQLFVELLADDDAPTTSAPSP